MYQGEALVVAAELMGGPTHCPTLGDEFLYLLGVDHHGQSRQVEVVAKALPRDGVSGLYHDGKCHNLYVGEPQLLSKECQGVLASLPESKSQSPEDKAIYACFKESFFKNVKKLPATERTVFLMSNGFCGYSKKSLSEIGAYFGKTKQWAWYKSQAAERIMAEWMAEWVA